jgi:hypothetical protein
MDGGNFNLASRKFQETELQLMEAIKDPEVSLEELLIMSDLLILAQVKNFHNQFEDDF